MSFKEYIIKLFEKAEERAKKYKDDDFIMALQEILDEENLDYYFTDTKVFIMDISRENFIIYDFYIDMFREPESLEEFKEYLKEFCPDDIFESFFPDEPRP